MSSIIIKVGVALGDVSTVLDPIRRIAKQVMEASTKEAQKSATAQKEAIGSVTDASKKSADAQMRNAGWLAAFRIRAKKQSADAEKAAEKSLNAELDRMRAEQTRDAKKHLADVQRARDRAIKEDKRGEAEKLKEAEAWARRRLSIMQNSFRMEQSMREAADRAAETARNKAASHEQRVAAQTAREQVQAAAKSQSRLRRYAGSAMRGAGRGIGTGSAMLGGPGSVMEAAQMPINFGKQMLGGMGADLDFGSAAGRAGNQERKAAIISNQAYDPSDASGRNAIRQDPKQILKEARATANEVGIATDDALDGINRFVGKTGDLATIRPMMADLSKLAKSYGAELGDMADAAAEVSMQMGNVEGKSQLVMDVLKNITAQGKLGTVEIAHLASKAGKVVASAGLFENRDVASGKIDATAGKGSSMKAMFALAQLDKKGGAGSVSEQVTGVQAFMSSWDKSARQGAFKELTGKSMVGSSGLKRDWRDLLTETLKAAYVKSSKGGPDFASRVGQVVYDERAKRPSRAAQTEFLEAVNKIKSKNPKMSAEELAEKGAEAWERAIERLTKATIEHDEMMASLTAVDKDKLSEAQRFNNKMDELGGQLAHELLPVLPPLAAALGRITGVVVSAIDSITNAKQDSLIRENFGTGVASAQVVSNIRSLIKEGKPITEEQMALIKGHAATLDMTLGVQEADAKTAVSAAKNPDVAHRMVAGLDKFGRVGKAFGPGGSWSEVAHERAAETQTDTKYRTSQNDLLNVQQDRRMLADAIKDLARAVKTIPKNAEPTGAPSPKADRPGQTRSTGAAEHH